MDVFLMWQQAPSILSIHVFWGVFGKSLIEL